MILNPMSVASPRVNGEASEDCPKKVDVLDCSCADIDTIADVLERTSQLGIIHQSADKHFYSNGAFNLVQLMLYVLRQTGAAHVFLSTYSIAEDSISTLADMSIMAKFFPYAFSLTIVCVPFRPSRSPISLRRFPTAIAARRFMQRWHS